MNDFLISQIDFFFKAASDSIFKELSSLETFQDRINFAEKHFDHLSSGSSRVIYTIGKDKVVLKLAKNSRGIAQNVEESSPKMKCKFINETLDSDPDGYWKTSPFRDKITEKEFESLTNIPFKLFGEAIEHSLNDVKKPKDFDKASKMDLFKDLIKVAKDANLMAGDLIRISSWGKSSSEGKDFPILLDAGLTKNVYDEFYTSSSSFSARLKSLGIDYGKYTNEKGRSQELSSAQMNMEEIWKQESLEATNMHDAVEMYAFDLGYQGIKLPHWLILLGHHYKIDVHAEHKNGAQSK